MARSLDHQILNQERTKIHAQNQKNDQLPFGFVTQISVDEGEA